MILDALGAAGAFGGLLFLGVCVGSVVKDTVLPLVRARRAVHRTERATL